MRNKIKTFQTILLLNLAASASAVAGGSAHPKAVMDDFVVVGDANWTIESELATASSGNGFLVSHSDYDNFYLKVEFQAGPKSNSGIFLRCANREVINDQTCYEVNIFDTRPDQEFRTGAITGYSSPKAIINSEDGKWHTYEIYAVADQIRVLLDGRETAAIRNEKHARGSVALQRAAGDVQFRNLVIEDLPEDALKSRPSLIDGVWELEAMYTVDEKGEQTPWCKGSFGVIIYTSGYMSTAVNCTTDPNKSVLYSGPFHIEGKTVFHNAINYGHPSLQKVFSRGVELKDENHLELSGDLGSSKVIVKWTRR